LSRLLQNRSCRSLSLAAWGRILHASRSLAMVYIRYDQGITSRACLNFSKKEARWVAWVQTRLASEKLASFHHLFMYVISIIFNFLVPMKMDAWGYSQGNWHCNHPLSKNTAAPVGFGNNNMLVCSNLCLDRAYWYKISGEIFSHLMTLLSWQHQQY
jgi:hypothetical protein